MPAEHKQRNPNFPETTLWGTKKKKGEKYFQLAELATTSCTLGITLRNRLTRNSNLRGQGKGKVGKGCIPVREKKPNPGREKDGEVGRHISTDNVTEEERPYAQGTCSENRWGCTCPGKMCHV